MSISIALALGAVLNQAWCSVRHESGLGPALLEFFLSRTVLIHASENVTQFASDDKRSGNLDFLHAFRPASLAMLDRAARKAIFDGEQTIPVIQPEDLIGLKVQAITNDTLRTPLDMVDVEALMRIFGEALDWERIEGYFQLFDKLDIFETLRSRYHVHTRKM